MTFFWIGIGWLAAAAALGILLGRAIAFATDGRLARGWPHRIPDGIHAALIPIRGDAEMRAVSAARRDSRRLPNLYALAGLLLLGACAVPTSEEPRVTSSSGTGATVEYSGEGAGEADVKADEVCARSGKQAARASTRPGATGGSVRSYDCTN